MILMTNTNHNHQSTVSSHHKDMAANVSSIAQALADTVGTIHIPKPFTGPNTTNKESSFAIKGGTHTGLPTPPNSISPYLPAHSLIARARQDLVGSPPSQIDSDIELGEALEYPKSEDRSNAGYSATTDLGTPAAHGVITPALIARDYLPDIVLGKGQIAVKDVINQLSNSLPGFNDIPPAKARRIVVGALETRRGGPDGNVEFEKTGWGRWVGRLKHQPSRREGGTMQTIVEGQPSPAFGPLRFRRTTSAMKIPGSTGHIRKRRRLSHGSWAAESNTSSTSDQIDRMDTGIFPHDNEEMSIDGDGDRANRYGGLPAKVGQDREAFYSDTDEEDWASMGVEAWRSNSYTGGNRAFVHRRTSRRSRTRSPFTALPQSLPAHHSLHNYKPRKPSMVSLDFTSVDADAQERDAIEALMNMGSM